MLAVNVAAPIELCRQFISKHLADGTEGSIVNIASVVAHTGSEDPSYGASKGALVSLTKGLAKTYGGRTSTVPSSTSTADWSEPAPNVSRQVVVEGVR
ncbi:SDR family NAD(P)-dependent oxidoreductase [Kribbella sp. NBC_01245]|uniref:SDR family NAD(P)-dependent oxidoreductase n=1 Tax=Kribbella sp. NBC_01245 TaxID=2903578 RepID=UPI003FA582B4